jgi:DNA-binding MarR family transcriptional regulator
MADNDKDAEYALCAEIASTCTNFRVRRISRLLAAIHDEALRPTGLKGTQFNLLVALTLAKSPTMKRLAEILGVDRTSLTRSLAPLERDGLVESAAGEDGRERKLKLTRSGRRKVREAAERWRVARALVSERLGARNSEEFNRRLKTVEDALARH